MLIQYILVSGAITIASVQVPSQDDKPDTGLFIPHDQSSTRETRSLQTRKVWWWNLVGSANQ